MKSVFDKEAYEELANRIHSLKPDAARQWGKMSIGQMVWHCQIPVRLAVENRKSKQSGNPLVRWLFKKQLYNDTPWRKSLPTIPIARATMEKDFETERKRLLENLQELYAVKDREAWNPHPIFGRLTPTQWGQMQYKHLDHHLRQFGG